MFVASEATEVGDRLAELEDAAPLALDAAEAEAMCPS